MVDLVNWVRGRLGNRPDSEHGQAIVRIVLIVLILGFVLLPSTRAQPDLEQYQGVLAIVRSGLVLSLGIFACCWPGPGVRTCAGSWACWPTTD